MGKETRSANGAFQKQASVSVSFCSCEKGLGRESCSPRIRNQYLFCFVAAGNGTLSVGDREQNLPEGQGMLITPNTTFRFVANDLPWEFYQIGFDGAEIPEIMEDCGLSEQTPTFRTDDYGRLTEVFKAMVETFEWDRYNRFNLLALFYSAVSLLQPTEALNRKSERTYVKKALDYIHHNYADRVRIEDLARYVGLDRTYLFKLFVKNVGKSPQEYLIHYRLDRAATLLLETDLAAEKIAETCGFRDSPSFCKHFKANFGLSPLAYRKKNRSM